MATSNPLPSQCQPGKTFKFPKRQFGKSKDLRSFRADWFEKWKWLHYDINLDAAFCHICMRAASEKKFLASTKRDPAFISKGFTYWKEATSAFKMHEASRCHCEAIEAVIMLPKEIMGDVGEVLSSQVKEEKKMNRKIFLTVLQNISFLAKQGLAFRGGSGDLESNFTQLLLLRSIDNPEIVPWMNKKTNKYTSHDIQNECLQIMALNIVRDLSKAIRDAGFYTIMADECTDISNKEQFTICIRWVDDQLIDHEDFIGLYQVNSIDADCLFAAIKDTLLRMGLNLFNCRGQCYDGASNMCGIRNGVAVKLSSEEKRAIYSHCYGHTLNLAVGTTIKSCKICNDAMDVAYEVSKLIKYSPKRNAALDRIKSESTEIDPVDIGIRTLCPTRWTVRGDSISSILENYSVLKTLWDECLEGSLLPDVKGRIIGVKSQMMDFKLLFGLRLCERILKITDNLSKTLQNQSLSAAEAQVIARQTLQTLNSIRSDEMFKLFWEHLIKLQERTDTDEPVLPRKRRAPKRFEVGDGTSHHAGTVEDHYRAYYFEALDLAITSIEDRFNQPGYQLYQNLENLLLKAANKKDYSSELKHVVSFYEDDLDERELETQLEIFGSCFTSNSVTLREALKFLQDLSCSQQVFYKQVCSVARLILVLPATNAASERSFSTMKRIKSYLRSTMGQLRLNHLMTLNIYKDSVDKLDLISIANQFVRGSEHRFNVFGTF